MDRFLPFVDLFLKDKTKTEVCKLLLENFALHQKETTSDPVVLNAMMYLGRVRLSSSFWQTRAARIYRRRCSLKLIEMMGLVAFHGSH